MPRHISRKRLLTAEERTLLHQQQVREAEEEFALAQAALDEVIASEPPLYEIEYVEVKPGEVGYEDAPFENSLIMQSRAMALELAAHESPWTELVKPGVYPAGLSETAVVLKKSD